MEIAFFLLVCGIISYYIGAQKGEGGCAFVTGLLLGPIGILIALIGKGNRKHYEHCRELMHKDATVCPHCQRAVTSTTEMSSQG